ncbi:MAG TPA: glycosyltransferase, partial [Alphaproteobacteria bacterium]|nr:glycosyltransferase [Alphaproteobacteria bacterium]
MVTETRPEKVAGAAEHPAGGGAQPGVSVIIPAYNAAGTLRRAVNSVFSQHHPVLELIIVDDASSDDTPDLIRTMDHPKLRYIRLARNGGVSNARNQGIEAAKGELIAFLDADDEWLPNKISLQMNEFLSRKNISLVSCDSYDIAPSGEVMGLHSSERAPAAGARAWVTLLKYAFITTSTALIPKQYLSITGGFDSNLRVAEDQDLWIRLARLGEVAFVNEPLVLKHFVPASLSIGGPAHDLLTYLLP